MRNNKVQVEGTNLIVDVCLQVMKDNTVKNAYNYKTFNKYHTGCFITSVKDIRNGILYMERLHRQIRYEDVVPILEAINKQMNMSWQHMNLAKIKKIRLTLDYMKLDPVVTLDYSAAAEIKKINDKRLERRHAVLEWINMIGVGTWLNNIYLPKDNRFTGNPGSIIVTYKCF